MDNVEIPNWIEGLPLAPEFRPTDTEFADPIAYISKIEKEASAFGICKVIPPLPKPSKRYVLNNLNRSLSKSRAQCLDSDLSGANDRSKRVSGGKGDGTEAKAVFTTRQQELGQAPKRSRVVGSAAQAPPSAQKQVWQSGEVYTLEQFESKSKAFSRSVLGAIKEVTPQVIEALFWKATKEKPIYIDYANDVPGSGFGEPEGLLRYIQARKRRRKSVFAQRHQGKSYCMQQDVHTVRNTSGAIEPDISAQSSYTLSEPGKECANQPTSLSNATSQPTKPGDRYASAEVEGTAGWKLTNSPWNLQVIARSAGSLTRFMLDDIPGVTSPMVYIGMLFSWFAWHVEDHELHSLNFLHMGSPKTWYAVPGDYAFAFEEVTRKQAYGGDIDHLAALKLLGEKTTLLSPELVIASGIPCCRLVQNPGEFVVTFPRAYHVGFSHGFNCGEAANFGTPQWLTVAKDAAVRRAVMDHLPMLSHQQLLYLLTMSFISRVPKSLLAGVRGSRLRDRLKKEREILVKKAFIEDVLKENNLLHTLLGKDLAFRAVLWHPDSLPSFTKESLSHSGVPMEPVIDKEDDHFEICNKNADPDCLNRQLTSYMETVNDMYLDSDDLSCDFQVDSGTLPCVACGILGYPFMAVVQPLKKSSMGAFTAEYLTKTREAEILQKPALYYHDRTTESAILAANTDERWNATGFLRPRIFCLEHAIKIEELLRPKGGTRMLIICHSDFQKIKANATAIAEEIGTAFNYKELLLDSASMEELNFIDHAIDSEQLTDCKEDWTSKLGMNLRFGVKTRISCPSEKIEHALNLDYLLSVIAPRSVISGIKWCCRKSRTKRDKKLIKSNNSHHLKKDEVNSKTGASMERKDKVLLQYSRRKYRIILRDCAGSKSVSGCNVECLPEVTDANCGNVDTDDQDTSGAIFVKNMEADSAELLTSGSSKKCGVLHDEVEKAEANKKHATNLIPTELVNFRPFDSVIHENLPLANRLSREIIMTQNPASTSADSILQQMARADGNANEVNEGLDTETCHSSPDYGNLGMEKSRIISDNSMGYENNPKAEARELMTISSSEEMSSKQDDGYFRVSSSLDNACNTTCVTEIVDILVQDEACISNMQGVNKTCKHDRISTSTESTTTMEVDSDNPTSSKLSHKDSCLARAEACALLVNKECDKKEKTTANAKMTSGNRSKRAREVVLMTEVPSDFVKSPCEGLRPRKKKDDLRLTHKIKWNITTATAQQKPQATKSKKYSGNSNSPSGVLRDGNEGSYKCNLEGCRMCFKTRAALSLHKRNRCHYEDCGKRFRSHKYVLLHQRVHDDERPLKCTWKGCGMTFKWAWARTEHLRLHTGERPYECKVEGCGLTFRFVSDFSRHRKKTGHCVNLLPN